MEKRYSLLLFITVLMLIIWIIQLVSVQIFDPHELEAQIALRQNPTKKIINPKRGNILTSDHQLLVSSVIKYQLDIDLSQFRKSRPPEKFESLVDTASVLLSRHTKLSEQTIKKRLKRDITYLYIDNDISESDILKLKEEFKTRKIDGLNETFSKIDRTYPKAKLAARLLGMVGPPAQNNVENSAQSIYRLEGKCGLEKSMDDILSGSFGWQQTISDAKNKRIPIIRLKEKPAIDGNNIILTMDMDIQEILEEHLRKGIIDYQAKNAIGIIMDPYSGDIIALSGITDTDSECASGKIRSQANLVASFMFEPGSVMKPITALLAIEEKTFEPDELISTNKYNIKYGKNKTRTIKDDHKFKELNMKDIIAHSSNVGISKTVERIGSNKLYERMLALGFGQSTSSNLSNEASGIFRKLKDWQGYSLHSISFGQEISVTVLQLASAYCAFANGGDLMRPNIIKQIEDSNGKIIQLTKPQRLRTISDKKSLDTLKQYLKSVVDYGTARNSKLKIVDFAGKTGTAEKKILGEQGYSKEKYTSVFTGFFPVEKPKYVMVIVFDEPDYASYSYYASNSAAPAFAKIAEQIVKLPESNILSDITEEKTTYIEAPACIGLSCENVEKLLQKQNIKAEYIGRENGGLVLNQYPKPGTAYDDRENIRLIFGLPQEEKNYSMDLDYQMPDLNGLTIRQAMTKTNKRGIKLIIEGNGVIYSQSILPETQIKFGEKCRIKAK